MSQKGKHNSPEAEQRSADKSGATRPPQAAIPPPPKRRRRALRFLAIALAFVVVLLASAVVIARVKFNGEALGETVSETLTKQIRGKVEVQSIEWGWSAIGAVFTGGDIPVTVTNFKVYDEFGDVVVSGNKATAVVAAHPLIFGGPNFIFRDIRVNDGGYALIKQVSEPYPQHKYDRTVVSLVSSFYAAQKPAFRLGSSAATSAIFDLQHYEVENVDMEFRFPDFTAKVYGIAATGSLFNDNTDPLERKMYYSLAPTASRVEFRSPSVNLDLLNLQVSRLAQIPEEWPRNDSPTSMQWHATATTTEGAELLLQGGMFNHFDSVFRGDYKIKVAVKNAGGELSKASAGIAGGDALALDLAVTGPMLGPKLSFDIRDLDIRVPMSTPLEVHVARAIGAYDTAIGAGTLERTIAQVRGGEVQLSATGTRDPFTFSLDLDIPKAIDLGPYLPPTVRRVAAGSSMSGTAHAFGNAQIWELDKLNLRLGRVALDGKMFYRPIDKVARVQNLGLGVGSTYVKATGEYYVDDGVYDFSLSGQSSDLDRWLAFFGAPAVAKSARGTAHVTGKDANPTVTAALDVGGVPVIDSARSRLSYKNGVLIVEKATSSAFSGDLLASGKLALGNRPHISGFKASGTRLDLSKIPGVGAFVSGFVDVSMQADGPVATPKGELKIDFRDWSVGGDAFADTELTLRTERDGNSDLTLSLARVRGGALELHALRAPDGQLSGILSLREMALSNLPLWENPKAPAAGGDASAELQLSGTLGAPTLDGRITLLAAWFHEAFLGSAAIDIERQGDGVLAVSGRLFQDQIIINGTVGTVPPFEVDLTATLNRVEFDRLAPVMVEKYGARGWVRGTARVRTQLMPKPGHKPDIELALDEAVLTIENESIAGRPAPIRLRNLTPLLLAFDGETLQFLDEVVIQGPAGDFKLSGLASQKNLALKLVGGVSVKLLQPYLRTRFEEMDGQLLAEVQLTGPIDKWRATGTLVVSGVRVKPTGQDAIVKVPAGKIEFTNDSLSITGLSMEVFDEFSEEKAELRISGGVKLDNFRPSQWAIQIDGSLAGKMLLVVAPEAFSAATGVAEISVNLLGDAQAPDIDGTVTFSPKGALTLTPRGVRREIAFTGGEIYFTDDIVEIDHVQGWVDDEGFIEDMSGDIRLVNWQPTDADISIVARDVPFRIPQQLELSMNLNGVRVSGGFAEGFSVTGPEFRSPDHIDIEIVDGRYVGRFPTLLDVVKPSRSVDSGPSVLDSVPLIANAELDLILSSRALFVRNNVADMELGGQVRITGTPADPRLDGAIRVEHGVVKFAEVRAKFTRTSGTVNFEPTKSFPDDSPTLNITSESDYRDTAGQDHQVILDLIGPLSNLQWDLRTSAGLNRSETLALIISGRTFDETRVAIGDEPVARAGDFQGVRSTEQIEGNFGYYDQLAKVVSSDLLSTLIANPIQNITQLDVINLRLGATGSFGVYLEENITRSMRAIGEYERSSRGSTWDGRVEYRVTDRVSADAEYLRKQYDDDAEEDISNFRVKFTYRIPIIP